MLADCLRPDRCKCRGLFAENILPQNSWYTVNGTTVYRQLYDGIPSNRGEPPPHSLSLYEANTTNCDIALKLSQCQQ